MKAFDPTGPLPMGTMLLEASAGTGKTHAITALAVRYLAETGTGPDGLTLITFSRSATQELRERLRDRVAAAVAVLAAASAGQPLPAGADPVDRLLADVPPPELAQRLGRLEAAAAGFDQVTVMTIHEFCQASLAELGILATADLAATLVEDLGWLREDVVHDLYLQRYAHDPSPPPLTLAEAEAVAKEALDRADAVLVPPGPRLDFAAAVREEFNSRKGRLGLFSFDDQLRRLLDCLTGPAAADARAQLQARCPVVLVDEFQDTDPVQWRILELAFHGSCTLVLIGDPKQAIYSFRGADVAAYQAAVRAADDKQGLAVNYRADAGVVQALGSLFAGAELGPGITVPSVTAHHQGRRLRLPDGSDWNPPVRIRTVTADPPMKVARARQLITADLVRQVQLLLTSGATLADRPLAANDIAVLVRNNKRGQEIVQALSSAGVAAAFSGQDSVFASRAAAQWLTLLRALHEPRRASVRAASRTDFLGVGLAELATASDQQLADWAGRLAQWRRIHLSDGIAALFVAVQADGTFAARVRQRRLGARDLTDHRHLAELLHQQERSGLSLGALVSWLAEAITDAADTGERQRRLETDGEAVQIMTIHKAKGLQFPVVLLPEAADAWVRDDQGQPVVYHVGDRRHLDLGGAAAGRAERWSASRAEEGADALRTLYVGATRAQSQLTMWWSRTSHNTAAAPLHRLLFRRRDLPGEPEPAYPVDEAPGSGQPAELGWLAEAGIAVQPVAAGGRPAAQPARTGTVPLATAPWDRQIDRTWRRTSYSGLTAAVHSLPALPLPAGVVEDETEPAETALPAADGPPSPMADLPGGTAFGTCVHQVLEELDWYCPQPGLAELSARLLAACTSAIAANPLPIDPVALAQALLPSLLTPLGSLTGGRRLADLPVTDRLSELEFELPLGAAGGPATLRQLGRLLADGLPPDDPLASYPDQLRDPALAGQVLHGYLTGSIDSVLRVPGPGGVRFVVIDYKTNRISQETDLRQTHFSQAAMTAEMERSHYPLQALLYLVALHRFLARRLPGYDPGTHLGGAGYLFVRGLGGAEPVLDGGLPTGVFAWHPPARTVVAASELLAGGNHAG